MKQEQFNILKQNVMRFDVGDLDLSRERRHKLSFIQNLSDITVFQKAEMVDGLLLQFFDKDTSPETCKIVLEEVKKEFYLFLCTENEKYKTEREMFTTNIPLAISALAGIIAAQVITVVAIPSAVVTALVAACFFLALKIGKNVFCNLNKDLAQ